MIRYVSVMIELPDSTSLAPAGLDIIRVTVLREFAQEQDDPLSGSPYFVSAHGPVQTVRGVDHARARTGSAMFHVAADGVLRTRNGTALPPELVEVLLGRDRLLRAVRP